MQDILKGAIFLLIAVSSLGYLAAADDCKGCVVLDSITFDKIIPKFKAAVVKFDVAFPYGEKHEEYTKIASETKDSVELLVCEVGVKDFGAKENSDLAERFDIKKENYPAVLLFVQGKPEPFRFEWTNDADFTADSIKRFIRQNSGVYLGLPGCVEKLDKLAEQFKSAKTEKDRKGVLEKAQAFQEKLPEEQKQSAKVYIKTMERILERGDVFVPTEQSRLEGLLKGKLSNDKKKLMEERRNILQSFTVKDEL